MEKIEKMLAALLRSNNSIHWIGGYVHGRTAPKDKPLGDKFIILYPASDYLEHKVCRVYENDFKKLPPYISLDFKDHLPETNPTKEQAGKRFVACDLFQIVTYLGKDTQMGREVRFSDTLHYKAQAHTNQGAAIHPDPEGWPTDDEFFADNPDAVEPEPANPGAKVIEEVLNAEFGEPLTTVKEPPTTTGQIKVNNVVLPANVAPPIRKIIEVGAAESVPQAAAIMNKLDLTAPGTTIELVANRATIYRLWRDETGKNSDACAKLVLEGKLPPSMEQSNATP